MSTGIKLIAAGEVFRTAVNTRLQKIADILSAFPGSQITDGTVSMGKLANQRAVMAHPLYHADIGARTNGDILWGGRVPLFDGATDNSWYLRSASIFVRSISGATSNSLTLYKNGSTTGNSIDLGALSSGVPGRTGGSSPALAAWSAQTFTLDDYWDIRFTKSGGPTIADALLILYFSKKHVVSG